MEAPQKENINFSIYMHFAFRVLVLGSLISILPLVFVNLPLRVAFLGFPTFFYVLIMLALNVATFVACFAFACKLILSWGVKEHAFSITKN
ncbi:hypothetical protein [Methylicorpusculum sp.]|uniref:hypothetical protein n=1 Tax=Methylicorpusculum sp. TaxID=2713644 RepID=UPI002ABB405F|nr:hypothetical protein [Methylicorpusculum sp.]MDZ4151184.1 hypothetical protein [Methylicorpusculum sp.]